MNTSVETDLGDWRNIRTQYQILANVELTPLGVSDWLVAWSDLEKAILERWTLLKRPAYRDKTDREAAEAYEAFTREMFSTHKALTEPLTRKLLAMPEDGADPRGRELRRRMSSEADLFRPENVPLHAEIIDLATAYSRLPTADGPDAWLREREAVSDLFLKMVTLRRRLSHNAGLPDYRAYRWRELNRLDYTPELCRALHRAIETIVVPVVSALEDTVRGVQSPPFGDADTLERTAQAVLAGVDPEVADYFARLRDDYLDLGERPGKRDGDEEWFFPVTGLPYLHINSLDLFTVIHECGHGLHDVLSLRRQGLFWEIGGPEEFQEFAALSLQTLTYPCLSEETGGPLSPDDARAARDANLWLCLQSLPRFARDDAFQHWVYGEAPEDVTAVDLDAQWLELTRRFLPQEAAAGNDIEVMTGWQRWNWSLVGQPFYMISYLGGVLGAWQVWRNALADHGAALRAYKAALGLGRTRPLPELYQAAGASWLPDAETLSELVGFVAAQLQGAEAGSERN